MRKKLGTDPFSRSTRKEKHLEPFFNVNESYQESDETPQNEINLSADDSKNSITDEQKILEFIMQTRNAGALRISRELGIPTMNVIKILKKLESENKISLKTSSHNFEYSCMSLLIFC